MHRYCGLQKANVAKYHRQVAQQGPGSEPVNRKRTLMRAEIHGLSVGSGRIKAARTLNEF